jgi:hypothetical protein
LDSLQLEMSSGRRVLQPRGNKTPASAPRSKWLALFTIEYSNINTLVPEKQSPLSHLSLHCFWEERRLYSEMAQTQSRKRKSDVLDDQDHDLQTSTPTGSPARKRTKITQSQKQALIDNLQLESELLCRRRSRSILMSGSCSYRTRPSPARPLCSSILGPSVSDRKTYQPHSDEPAKSEYGGALIKILRSKSQSAE